MADVKLGDRWVYTTPSGRTAHYKVVEVNARGKDGRDGYVRMVAEEHGFVDATPHRSDLPQPWLKPDKSHVAS